MTSDLPAKLLAEANDLSAAGYPLTADLLVEAADEIGRLQADVTELMTAANEALNP